MVYMKRSKIALRKTNCIRFGKITLLFAFVLFAGVVLPELLMNLSRLQFTGIFYVFRMANSKLLVSLRFQYHLINTSVKGDSLSPLTIPLRRAEPARPQLPAAHILQPIIYLLDESKWLPVIQIPMLLTIRQQQLAVRP